MSLSRLLLPGCLIGLMANPAFAQMRIWTQPTRPSQESLDRLNLQQSWRVSVPMDGRRDGIASIQSLGGQVIVQTLRGRIVCIDGASGDVRWFTSVGEPFAVTHEVGFNDSLILVSNGTRIYGLDRADGSQRWELDLPATPSSPPAADNVALYVNLSNGRLASYLLPDASRYIKLVPVNNRSGNAVDPNAAAKGTGTQSADPRTAAARGAPSAGSGRTVTVSSSFDNRSATISVRTVGGRTAVGGIDIKKAFSTLASTHTPYLIWDHQTSKRVQERPVIGMRTVMVATNKNLAILVRRIDGAKPIDLPTEAPIGAPIGQYADIAYLADRDGVVYAVDLDRGVFLWRHMTDGAISAMPQATDDDLYVVSNRGGLVRMERETGTAIWQNPVARHYVAINPKFVYATDHVNRLLVMDRRRGEVLGRLDTSEYVFPVQNETTDRILLAAHDGTVLCLNDKAYPSPIMVQTEGVKAAAPNTEPVKAEPKPIKAPGTSTEPAKPDAGNEK